MGSTGCGGKEREAGSHRDGLCDCISSLQVLLPAESRHAAVCFSEDVRYHRNVAHSEKLFRKLSLAKVLTPTILRREGQWDQGLPEILPMPSDTRSDTS